MTDPAQQILGELKQLRRGRGLQAADLAERIGPQLRRLSQLTEDGTDVRPQVVAALSALIVRLPADQLLAVQAAFALTTETERMALLGSGWIGCPNSLGVRSGPHGARWTLAYVGSVKRLSNLPSTGRRAGVLRSSMPCCA